MAVTRCPRCSSPVATHFARGQRRPLPHRCSHGLPCRREDPSCDACAAGRAFLAAVTIQAALRRAGGFEPDPFDVRGDR